MTERNTIKIAQVATIGEYEAERHDPSAKDLGIEGMAEPQIIGAFASWSTARRVATEALFERLTEQEDITVQDAYDATTKDANGRVSVTIRAFDEDGDLVGVAVIEERDIED